MSEPVIVQDDHLAHYGVKRRSGRYPWGSGKDPQQGGRDIRGHVTEMRRQGLSDTEIARGLGINTTELRAKMSIAGEAERAARTSQAVRLKGTGMSNSAIGREMGIPESSVRNLIAKSEQASNNKLVNTAGVLKKQVDSQGPLDIGKGTENYMGISRTRLNTAVAMLRDQGYEVRNIQIPQLGTGAGMKTTTKVLLPPGSKGKFIQPTDIKTVAAYTENDGQAFTPIKPPVSVKSSRVAVRYAGEGGENADGVIYIRPGVNDLSLGAARYAQVRIAVDNSHYLKGMAMYKDDLPAGVDLMFNTKKSRTSDIHDAMKPLEGPADSVNAFKTSIRRQRTYTDARGREKQSPLNIVNEEGQWRDWRPSLSSQVLSKQSPVLARNQLGEAFRQRAQDLEEIRSLTNPVVKQRLLTTFADEADSAAVHLKAAALPRQGTHVILPFSSIRTDQIYAPNFKQGERVVLIRHPHGGTFEIPELVVNNKNAEARRTLGPGVRGRTVGALDAVGIHPDVAKRLSGADFDGDAVLVIPNGNRHITTSSALAGLKDFKPDEVYAPFHGMKTIDGGTYDAHTGKVDYHGHSPKGAPKQQLMGDVSNLITDMTIKGARPDEIAAAVRHSMVVIDADKHNLNYKQSRIDNGIDHLKEKYQGKGPTGRLAGASTIVSRASSEVRVLQRTPRPMRRGGPIDLITGAKAFEPTGKSFIDPRTGERKFFKTRSTRLAEAADARALSSGTKMEEIYAAHSNRLKQLANQARLDSLSAGNMRYSPSAAKTYATEVKRLNAALNIALKNAPLERQAQIIAQSLAAARLKENPGLDADARRKIGYQELQRARDRVGARKHQIVISDGEWHAIQSGAISTNKLRQIMTNSDIDKLRERATPRSGRTLTPGLLAVAKARLASGYTQADVAKSLGIPVSTLNSALHPKKGG